MEITLLILACAAFGAFWYFNRPKKEEQSFVHETPSLPDPHPAPVVEVTTAAVEEAPAAKPKRTRKPREVKAVEKKPVRKTKTTVKAEPPKTVVRRSKKA